MTKLGDREIGSQRTLFADRSATAGDEGKVVTGVRFRRPDPTSEQINCEVYLEGEHEPVLAFFYVRMTMSFGDELIGQTFGAIRQQFRERDIAQAAGAAPSPYSFTLTTTGMPTQAEGRTAAGLPYYFWARHGEWRLCVGEPDWPTPYMEWPDTGITLKAWGSDETNGHMSEEQVRAVLDRYLVGVEHA